MVKTTGKEPLSNVKNISRMHYLRQEHFPTLPPEYLK